jgi:4-hydroxy 2-oxovalerate aldolase
VKEIIKAQQKDKTKRSSPILLDCTLRDGGLALEDAAINGESTYSFPESTKIDIARCLAESDIDIIELGSIEKTDIDKRGFAIYQDIESVSKSIPQKRKEKQMFAALYRGPDTPIDEIPEWNDKLCDVVRVIIRYSELKKSLEFCKELSNKGYKVSVQPMVTMRYSAEELKLLIDDSNEMNAYVLYFVDSYGYMQKSDIVELFRLFDNGLKPEIKIGFHAHNNINLAFANVQTFLDISVDRSVVIDSCILGMGQGAGNLQTEIITDFLNKEYYRTYNFHSVLSACEIIEKYWTPNLWSYSVMNLLPAINRTAYKFANILRLKYKLSYAEIHDLLRNIPEDIRHRYTPENAIKLMNLNGYNSAGVRIIK